MNSRSDTTSFGLAQDISAFASQTSEHPRRVQVLFSSTFIRRLRRLRREQSAAPLNGYGPSNRGRAGRRVRPPHGPPDPSNAWRTTRGVSQGRSEERRVGEGREDGGGGGGGARNP